MKMLTNFILAILLLVGADAQISGGSGSMEDFLTTLRSQGYATNSYRTTSFPRRVVHRPNSVAEPGSAVATETTSCHSEPHCPPVYLQKFMSVDGTCNNRVDKNKGRAVRSLKRLLPPDYADNTGRPRAGKHNIPLPSPRLISSSLSDTGVRPLSISHLVPFWGQFIVHDISRTPATEINVDGSEVECDCGHPSRECLNIPIAKDDIQYRREKKECFGFKRSLPVANSNSLKCDTSVRQQLNKLSGYIDVGTIYGSSQAHLDALMEGSGSGRLIKSRNSDNGRIGSLLPLQTEVRNVSIAGSMECPEIHRPPSTPCFVSGDVRANENSALISQHTFWMRHHNSIATTLRDLNPHWNQGQIFQNTRSIVSALTQMVTYGHFLPVLVGPKHMERFGLHLLRKGYWYGYDASYDATVSNAFTTAAFRIGHSLIGSLLSRPSPSWESKQGDDILLRDSFFNSVPIFNGTAGSSNSVLRGLMEEQAQKVDTTFTDDLRNFLFAKKGHFGDDLLSFNIQRGRDHGIPSYNQYRRFCGLKVAEDFNDLKDISSKTRKRLSSIYRDVDDIDLYIGGVAEEPVTDGAVGPTFACIISYQFRDIKKGDRFWHENGGVFQHFREDQLRALRATSYPSLLCQGIVDMRSVQPHPMFVESGRNRRRPCSTFSKLDLSPWQENRPVLPDQNAHIPPSSQWTSWFPSSSKSGRDVTPAETLSHLLRHRSDEVCHQVLDTQTRHVNRNLQVRFQCPPGTIKLNDFPPVDSDTMVWTDWQDNSSPGRSRGADDVELRSLRRESGCSKPFALQVQTIKGVPAGETEEVFEEFSLITGFICRGKDQLKGKCTDYRVRYLCQKDDGRRPTPRPHTTARPNFWWSEWVSSDSSDHNGDMELVSRARRMTRICSRPIRIEARTIKGHILASRTKDKIRRMDIQVGLTCYNSDQKGRDCNDYEVRFLCSGTDPRKQAIHTTSRTTENLPYPVARNGSLIPASEVAGINKF